MQAKFIGLIILFLFTSFDGVAQNIPGFQRRKWHFGTMLGTNTTTYSYSLNSFQGNADSVIGLNLTRRPGFGIHVPVISFNLHETVHFRFIPSISFHETLFEYYFIRKGETEIRSTRTEPTNLNFPLLFQLSSKRLGNFSAYATGGIGYSLDLASQQDVEQITTEPIIKLKQHDWQYHVGGGVDFYLPYFKLGIDIRLSQGITNLLIQDNTFYSTPLSYLKSKTWWFSITFEG